MINQLSHHHHCHFALKAILSVLPGPGDAAGEAVQGRRRQEARPAAEEVEPRGEASEAERGQQPREDEDGAAQRRLQQPAPPLAQARQRPRAQQVRNDTGSNPGKIFIF